MKLPELPPEPIRDEDQPGYQKEIWQPSWRCFCCEDTGIVRSRLAAMVIHGYNSNRDRLPICQAPGCNAGVNWLHLEGNIDMRLTAAICQELDRISREDWRQSTQQKFVNIQALSKKLAMPRSCERTEQDNREVQQRKAEIEATSSDQWAAMRNAYLEVDK
ncbi:hypothetical protein [Anabaena sp. CCY 0017]|uniref:hypothetical protein n=1 Tax=Anabaena sp. CCY 0017 TaxID=3103866 RepID=UPI0039C5CDBB